MNVFRALILRALSPCVFLLAVKWTEESGINTSALPLCLLMSTVVWFLLGYVGNGTNVHRSFVYDTLNIREALTVLFLANVYLQVGHLDENQQNILRMYALPFVNFKLVIEYFWDELTTLCVYIFKYLKILGFSPLKICSYVFYVTLHAVLIAMLIEVMYIYIMTTIYLTLSQNFLQSFDDFKDYPEGYVDPVNLNRDNFKDNVRTVETYTPSQYGQTFQKFSQNEYEYSDHRGDPLPYAHKSVARYVGEDVLLECSFMCSDKSSSTVRWYHDKQTLQSSRRFEVSLTKTVSETDENMFSVYSKLRIRHLRESDFGRYDCIFQETSMILNIKQLIKTTIKVYQVNLIQPVYRIIYRVVGSLIATQNFFWIHTEDDLLDISVHYTINDEPLESVCPGFQTHVCSIGAQLLVFLKRLGAENIDWDGERQFPYIDIEDLLVSIKRTVLYYCLCNKGFGVHKVYFLRQVYSEVRKRLRVVEVQHPFMFIVLPDAAPSLFRISDDRLLYSELETMIQTEKNYDVLEEKVQYTLKLLSSNEEKVMWIANVTQSSLLIVSFCVFYAGLAWFIRIYIKVFNISVRQIFITFPVDVSAASLAINDIMYDIFISHSEEELILVRETLSPFLENKCNIKVCVPERDFRPGKSLFHSHVECIQNSRRVIIVLSRMYLMESHCVTLQLEHIILPLIYEKKLQGKQLLVIKYDGECEVPQLLKWNLDVSVLAWTEYLHEDVKLGMIRRWLQTGKL